MAVVDAPEDRMVARLGQNDLFAGKHLDLSPNRRAGAFRHVNEDEAIALADDHEAQILFRRLGSPDPASKSPSSRTLR